jgi:hypothetical protein
MNEPLTPPTLADLLGREDTAEALAFARGMHPAELAEALSGMDERLRDLVVAHFAPDELATALATSPHYREDFLQGLALVADVAGPDDVAATWFRPVPRRGRRRGRGPPREARGRWRLSHDEDSRRAHDRPAPDGGAGYPVAEAIGSCRSPGHRALLYVAATGSSS